MTQESFGAISAGGTSAVPGGMGLMRNSSLLRATTDSPFSTAHSLADEAPHSVDIAANQRRSRNNSAGTLKEDADAAASTAASNKRKPSGWVTIFISLPFRVRKVTLMLSILLFLILTAEEPRTILWLQCERMMKLLVLLTMMTTTVLAPRMVPGLPTATLARARSQREGVTSTVQLAF